MHVVERALNGGALAQSTQRTRQACNSHAGIFWSHAHKPATCQESVAAAVPGHEAVHGHAAPQRAEGAAHPRGHAAGPVRRRVEGAGREAAPDGRVLELVRHAGQHRVDVVDHAGGGGGRARGEPPPDGGAQVGPGAVDDIISYLT